MPEKTFWTLLRKSWIALFQGPRFQSHQSVPKVLTCVGHFHLPKGNEMSIHFKSSWMDFDICCFELASLDVLISADSIGSSLLVARYGIRLRNESAAAKKHRIVSRQKTSFFRMTFFRAEKMAFFRTPKRTSWTTQKAQCKNITRKRKHDEKYIRKNSPKKWLFLEFCFAPALARPKKHNYFAQSRFPKYRCFFDVRGQKNGKNSTPSAMGETPWSKYVSAEKKKNVFGKNPQKSSFLGIFRN